MVHFQTTILLSFDRVNQPSQKLLLTSWLHHLLQEDVTLRKWSNFDFRSLLPRYFVAESNNSYRIELRTGLSTDHGLNYESRSHQSNSCPPCPTLITLEMSKTKEKLSYRQSISCIVHIGFTILSIEKFSSNCWNSQLGKSVTSSVSTCILL